MNTPRTDAFEKQRIVEATTNDIATEAWSDFARLLERENERMREALRYIARCPMGSHLKLEDAPELARKALAAQPEEKT